MPKHFLLGSPVLIAALFAAATATHACSIDGVPSVYANGHLAVRNFIIPKKASFLTWSPFEFRQPFARDASIQLREDTIKVARSLGAAALHQRWRWSFGDGQTAAGVAVKHQYTHPGQYRIVIAAYDPSTKQWFPFDSVQVTIQH